MFLLILDKNPHKAAELVPDRLKFKQLLELCQLICSAGISNVFKPIKQGKELQEWIKSNSFWVLAYYNTLFTCCFLRLSMKIKEETCVKIRKISNDLDIFQRKYSMTNNIETVVFRYVKEYSKFTRYFTNCILLADVAIEEYKKYVEWKEKIYESRRKNV